MTFDRTKYANDLRKRVLLFANNVRTFVRGMTKDIASIDDCRQLIRSSGSVAANYMEADEALSRKDFFMRIGICRKEAKESATWLCLLASSSASKEERRALLREAKQLTRIFHSISKKKSQTPSPSPQRL